MTNQKKGDQNKFNAIISSLLIFIVLSTLFIKFAMPIREGDFWWQIAYGRYFLNNLTLIPDHTIFSWTPSEGNWIYCAWLTEIFLFLLFKAGGLFILFGLRYLFFLFFVFLFWRLAVRYQISLSPLTWMICLLSLLMSGQAGYIKPEIFSYLFMTLTVWTWFKIKTEQDNQAACYLLPLYCLLWVNSHGAFIFGMTYLGCIGIGELFNILFSTGEAINPNKRKHFFIALCLCGVAFFATPYTWKYPAQLVNDFILGSVEIEHCANLLAYKSIFDHLALPLHFVDYMIISILILLFLFYPIIRAKRIDFTLIISVLVFLWLYTRFVRTTYFWAIVFAFSSLYLFFQFSKIKRQTNRNFSRVLNILILTLCIFLASRSNYNSVFKLTQHRWFGFGNSYINPAPESEFIKHNLSDLRLGNDYETGGYLLWDLWPDTKIFIDPRYFPFEKWFLEYLQFISGNNPSFLNKFPCEAWLLKLEYPVVNDFLKSKDWKLVHYGPTACIFLKKDQTLPTNFSGLASGSISHIKNLSQASIVFNFATRIGDMKTARLIVSNLKYHRFLSSHRDIASQIYNSYGSTLLKNKDYVDAEKYLIKALKLNPEYAAAHSNLGTCFSIQGNVATAIKHYKRAFDQEPDNPSYSYNLAYALSLNGETEDAIRCLKHPLSSNMNQPKIEFLLGKLYMNKNEIQQAINHYRKALKLDPNLTDAKRELETALKKQTQITDGFKKVQEALSKSPNNAFLYYQRGILHEMNGDSNLAIQQYNKAIRLKPDFIEPYYNLGVIYSQRQELNKAITCFKKIVEFKPDLAKSYYNVACLFARQGNKDNAIHWLQLALDKGYNNWNAIRTDQDFDNIRESSDFQKLVKASLPPVLQ